MAKANKIQLQVEVSYKQILSIALPIAASILVPQINFITNNIFLGHLGETELAIAGITGVYYLIFAVVAFGLNNGIQALISRRAGENKVDEIGNFFRHGILIALSFSLAGILITNFIAPYVLSKTLHEQQDLDMALSFLRIRIWGLPFLYLYTLQNVLLVSTNQSKYMLFGSIVETAANILLDYGLIFGQFGFVKLGFNGAAYASVIAEFIGMIAVYGIIRFKDIDKQLNLYSHYFFKMDYIKKILHQSAPLILQFVISITSWEFFYILIEHHGSRSLAISNVMRNVFGLFGCLTWAFASTTNTMVSNIIGQGQNEKVMGLLKKILRLSVGSSLIFIILLNIAPGLLLKAYGQDESFIQAAIPVARIISLAMVLQSVSVIWLNAVTGSGNSKMNLLTESIAIVLYCFYVYFTLEYLNLSIQIGWMSEWLYWITLFVPSFWYMKSGKWKGKVI